MVHKKVLKNAVIDGSIKEGDGDSIATTPHFTCPSVVIGCLKQKCVLVQLRILIFVSCQIVVILSRILYFESYKVSLSVP